MTAEPTVAELIARQRFLTRLLRQVEPMDRAPLEDELAEVADALRVARL